MTFGREGISTDSSCDFRLLSSLSLPEICNWFAAQLMLSRRECGLTPMSLDTVLPGGDLERTGWDMVGLYPRPRGPRSFFRACFRGLWRCWKLRRGFTAGDPPRIQFAPEGVVADIGVPTLAACGVMRNPSSSMSSSMRSSSSEVDDVSEHMCMVLPSEPARLDRSWFPITDHSEFDVCSAWP